MTRHDIATGFYCFLELQAICGAIVVASWLIWWAVGIPVGNIPDLFLYVLTQVNLTVVLLYPVRFLYEDQPARYRWPLRIISILAISVVVVIISATIIYRVHSLRLPFVDFLHRSWKFPFVANLVCAFCYETYRMATRRLRSHNEQLQRTIELETAEREIEAGELRQAREIQRGLLPKDIPQLRDFVIAGAWEPARIVGGDYYDVIRLSKDKVAICIADVAGKGISAALLMANVQAAVRAFASESTPPSRVCAQINSVLFTNTAPEKFVTLFYGVLDSRTCTLEYTNAGHPRPLLTHWNGTSIRLENGGALLGVFPDWKYEDSIVQLDPGDVLLLFTDGITEAVAKDGEEFGERRLVEAAENFVHGSLDDFQSDLLARVKNFCNSQLSDDATLLIVAVTGMPRERKAALIRDKRVDEVINYAGALS